MNMLFGSLFYFSYATVGSEKLKEPIIKKSTNIVKEEIIEKDKSSPSSKDKRILAQVIKSENQKNSVEEKANAEATESVQESLSSESNLVHYGQPQPAQVVPYHAAPLPGGQGAYAAPPPHQQYAAPAPPGTQPQSYQPPAYPQQPYPYAPPSDPYHDPYHNPYPMYPGYPGYGMLPEQKAWYVKYKSILITCGLIGGLVAIGLIYKYCCMRKRLITKGAPVTNPAIHSLKKDISQDLSYHGIPHTFNELNDLTHREAHLRNIPHSHHPLSLDFASHPHDDYRTSPSRSLIRPTISGDGYSRDFFDKGEFADYGNNDVFNDRDYSRSGKSSSYERPSSSPRRTYGRDAQKSYGSPSPMPYGRDEYRRGVRFYEEPKSNSLDKKPNKGTSYVENLARLPKNPIDRLPKNLDHFDHIDDHFDDHFDKHFDHFDHFDKHFDIPLERANLFEDLDHSPYNKDNKEVPQSYPTSFVSTLSGKQFDNVENTNTFHDYDYKLDREKHDHLNFIQQERPRRRR